MFPCVGGGVSYCAREPRQFGAMLSGGRGVLRGFVVWLGFYVCGEWSRRGGGGGRFVSRYVSCCLWYNVCCSFVAGGCVLYESH